jgi:hypothetical protein
MTVVFTPDRDDGIFSMRAQIEKGLWMVTGTMAFDSSYPAGGEPFPTLSTYGVEKVIGMDIFSQNGYDFRYDAATNKVVVQAAPGVQSMGYSDIKGSANTESHNADAAALPTNGSILVVPITQTDLRTALGVCTVVATQPDVPRNICLCVSNDSGGPLNLYEGSTSFTVVGTYRGAPQTEIIGITSTGANKAIANTPKYRYTYGSKPFSTVTSITQGDVAEDMAGGLKIQFGLGSKLGLPSSIAAAADVTTLSKDGAKLATAGIVDATNMTINYGTLADGADVAAWYRSSGEIGPLTDLSGLTAVRFIAWGYRI